MTDLLVTNAADAHVQQARPGLNAGDTKWIKVRSGSFIGYVRPQLVNILGRTVLDATLVGRVGPDHVGQTYTLARATERWVAGRVTWANQPAVDGTDQVVVAATAQPDGGLVEFPVTNHMQLVADGTAYYGWRITTNSAAASQRFYATDSGEPAWELHITLSDAPEQPTNLRPDGGAVSTGTPILAWDFIDFGPESSVQLESRVMVDTPAVGVEPDEVTPDFDSGWVANTDPEYALAGSGYVSPGAGPTYWRVMVRDGDGNTSEWSDWAEFTVAALPALVIDTPTGPVGDPAIEVLAHLDGGTVEAWRILATGVFRGDVRADSGVQTGPVSWEVPTKNEENRWVFSARRYYVSPQVGWLYVQVWDDVDRAVAVGEQPYVDQWIEVEFVDDGTQVAPTDLTVTPVGEGDPRQTWSWESTDTADAWLLTVDGAPVERIDADDVAPVAGVYTWTDRAHVPPLRPHTLGVQALRAGERSTAAEVENYQVVVEGVWLLPEAFDHPIVLAGTAVSGFSASDRVATYEPLHGSPVDIVYGWTGRVGEFDGWIDHRQDVWADVDAVEELRTSHNRLARMVWGSQSITVRLRHPDVTSSDEILPENLEHVVRFGFVEVGD